MFQFQREPALSRASWELFCFLKEEPLADSWTLSKDKKDGKWARGYLNVCGEWDCWAVRGRVWEWGLSRFHFSERAHPDPPGNSIYVIDNELSIRVLVKHWNSAGQVALPDGLPPLHCGQPRRAAPQHTHPPPPSSIMGSTCCNASGLAGIGRLQQLTLIDLSPTHPGETRCSSIWTPTLLSRLGRGGEEQSSRRSRHFRALTPVSFPSPVSRHPNKNHNQIYIISIVSSSLQSHVTLWELLLAQRNIKHMGGIGGSWDIVKTKSWKAFMLLDNI